MYCISNINMVSHDTKSTDETIFLLSLYFLKIKFIFFSYNILKVLKTSSPKMLFMVLFGAIISYAEVRKNILIYLYSIILFNCFV